MLSGRDPSSNPARPPPAVVPLAIFYSVIFASAPFALRLAIRIVPSRADIPQVPVCKIVLTNCSMVIDIWKCLLTSFAFNREDCSNIEESRVQRTRKAHLYAIIHTF